MSEDKNLEDKLSEIEKYIYDPNRNPDLVTEKIRQDKLSKRRRAYHQKKLEKKKIEGTKSEDDTKKSSKDKKNKSKPKKTSSKDKKKGSKKEKK